jgi:hypothetical protein
MVMYALRAMQIRAIVVLLLWPTFCAFILLVTTLLQQPHALKARLCLQDGVLLLNYCG